MSVQCCAYATQMAGTNKSARIANMNRPGFRDVICFACREDVQIWKTLEKLRVQ